MSEPTKQQWKVTDRERQVILLSAQDMRVKEIAQLLGISQFTVQTHKQHIYDKLEVKSMAAAVAKLLSTETQNTQNKNDDVLNFLVEFHRSRVQYYTAEEKKPCSGQRVLMRFGELWTLGFFINDHWLDLNATKIVAPDEWAVACVKKGNG